MTEAQLARLYDLAQGQLKQAWDHRNDEWGEAFADRARTNAWKFWQALKGAKG